MAGLEVENSTVAAVEGAAGAEYLAALVPADEDVFVGLGNGEERARALAWEEYGN